MTLIGNELSALFLSFFIFFAPFPREPSRVGNNFYARFLPARRAAPIFFPETLMERSPGVKEG